MSDLVKKTNHAEEAASRLVGAAWDKPRIKALLLCYINRIQEFEDQVYSYYLGRTLQGAVGKHVDILGAIVNEDRNGLSDADYKEVIKIKISILKSYGTVRDILALMTLVSSDLTKWKFYEHPTAAFRVETYGIPYSNLISKWLKAAKLAGVGMDYAATEVAEEAFRLNSRQGGVLSTGKLNSRQGGVSNPSKLAQGYR